MSTYDEWKAREPDEAALAEAENKGRREMAEEMRQIKSTLDDVQKAQARAALASLDAVVKL